MLLWQSPFTPEHMLPYHRMLTYYFVLPASGNGKQNVALHRNISPNSPLLSYLMDCQHILYTALYYNQGYTFNLHHAEHMQQTYQHPTQQYTDTIHSDRCVQTSNMPSLEGRLKTVKWQTKNKLWQISKPYLRS